MGLISNRVASLKQGAIRDMFDKANELDDVINLGIGEPDMNTHERIIQEAYSALRAGKTHYTPNAGVIDLRKKISEYLLNYNINSDPFKNIIVTSGGMGALSLCLLCLVNEGDEVLIQNPQWLNHYAQIRICGGIPISIPTYEENRFKITAKEISKRISSKTKVLIINSPNNPTGTSLEYNELQEIADLAISLDLIVISDEVYSTLVYDGKKHISIASIKGMENRTITINSFSKSFAMTGWRIGYAVGNAKVIGKMIKLQENLMSCVNSSSQYAAIKALEFSEISDELRSIFEKRRNFVINELGKINGINFIIPDGTFYIFINIKNTNMTSADFANNLLIDKKVVTIPGSAFGEYGEGYIRLAYTQKEEILKIATKRIKKFVEDCRG